ncbi:DUF3515 domain-containing protein [Rhodococcus sp. HNM0569]|uniref:DUF3515 family protein n=1 Tax=Rhodococcus sp. HNM0569 TaxID=2716340 RepID=UPI00146C776A|nr:DUF3515 domain-containing protein [Rhodococcus sp. HNM0569]
MHGDSPEQHETPESHGPEDTGAADADSSRNTSGRHPAVIATAVALPVALVVGLIVSALLAGRNPEREPVALGPVPAPAAPSAECGTLMAALPDQLGDFDRAELVEPAPEATAAWQQDEGEPIVLRCGLDRPLEFDQAAALQVVNGVQWFEVSGQDVGMASSSWFAVDRGIYVGVTIPDGTGPTPLQDVSDTLSAALPQQPLDPAPVG